MSTCFRAAPAFFLCAYLSANTASAAILAYDDFDYAPVGSDLNTKSGGGSLGFSGAWSGTTSYNIGNGNLKSPSGPLPAVGQSVTGVAFGENRGIDRNLSTQIGTEGTSAYASILLQPQGILGQGAYGGWFALILRGSTDIVAGMNYGGGTYGLEVGFEKASTGVDAVIGKTVFLVLRFDFTEGVDPVYLYLNPRPGEPEPAPTVSLINLNVNFINRVSLGGPGGSAFDSLRIGTTYSDVVPASADFDGDKDVDGDDLARWESNYSTGTAQSQGDADDDGDVDGGDLMRWQRQVGFQSSPSVAAVPEPSTAALVMTASVAAASIYCHRRRSAKFHQPPRRPLRRFSLAVSLSASELMR